MRIIAGTFRGRTIRAGKGYSIRPTTDRAKQAIFDVLANRLDFSGIEVLDLFAGTGSLGFEALSRGAARATFVDTSRDSIGVLEKNIDALGCRNACRIHPADVFWFLRNTVAAYDLIFADPPFALPTIGTIPSAIHSSPCTRPGTYVVMEHGRNSDVNFPEGLYEVTQKRFGQTTALILRTLKSDDRKGDSANENRHLSGVVRPHHERAS